MDDKLAIRTGVGCDFGPTCSRTYGGVEFYGSSLKMNRLFGLKARIFGLRAHGRNITVRISRQIFHFQDGVRDAEI